MSSWDDISVPASKDEWDSISTPGSKSTYPPKSRKDIIAESSAMAAEGMNPFEKAVVGLGSTLPRYWTSIKQMAGQASPEDLEDLERLKALGGWGTAGQVVGDLAATAIPAAKGAQLAGKVLTKAVPAAALIGSVGGRTFNLGAAGTAATEGGISSGLAPVGEDESRLGNAAIGGTVGAVLPLAGTVGAKTRDAYRVLRPSEASTTKRASKILAKTLGEDELANVSRALETAQPTRLPQTTAALIDNPRVAALERGARERNIVDFQPHDEDVARRVWSSVQDDTAEAARAAQLAERPQKVLNATTRVLEQQKMFDGARKLLSNEFTALSNTDEALANPVIARALNRATAVIEDPNATPAVLMHLRQSLAKVAPQSQTMQKVDALLTEVGDSLSNDTMSYGIGQAARHAQQATEAEGAAGVRRAFTSPEGLPTTPQTLPSAEGEIPVVRAGPLRRAIASQESKLEPQAKADLIQTTEELRKHELFRPTGDTGGTRLAPDADKGHAMAAINATRWWPFRGIINVAYQRADAATQKLIDEALLNPDRFMQVLNAKQAAQAPLSKAEDYVRGLMMEISRAGAMTASTGE